MRRSRTFRTWQQLSSNEFCYFFKRLSMKYVDTIILLLLIVKKSDQTLLVPETSTSPISGCIMYIFNKYFINSTKILIKFSNQETSIISEISKIDLPFQINADDTSEIEGIDKRIPNDVIVILDEHTNISKILNECKWTAKTQFLIITQKKQKLGENMIELFRQFWTNNIVNVLLLTTKDDNVQIYTFKPFNRYDCAIHNPILIATWAFGQITTDKELIPKERVTNLNGCTLNATFIDFPPTVIFPNEKDKNGTKDASGIEVSILKEISNQLNFKPNFVEPRDGKGWGRMKPNPYGAFGDVYYKKSHFACGFFAYILERYINLDLSVAVSCDEACMSWAVPVGAKKAWPPWIRLLVSGFHNNLWCFIVFTITFTIVAFRFLSKVSEADSHIFDGNVETIFYTFRSSLAPSMKVPKSSFLRIVLLSWLWYSFVILSAYQALMGSKLTVPHRQPDIDTYKDLLESDLHITGLISSFRIATDGQDEKELKDIEKRFVEADFNFKEAIDKIITDENIAYIWTLTPFMYSVMQHPKAKGLIHFMKQCAYEYYPAMLLQKNCPFTSRVNRIIRALSEAGIICKWRKEYVYDIPQLEPSVQKLSLNRMIGSFVILGIGLGAALVALVVENLYIRYSSRKNSPSNNSSLYSL